jgi:Xaa-Pro aminopeptidase
MQYSPNNRIFYVGLTDAGTVELLRSFGKNIVSSADLVAQFEATWTEEQIESHFAAGKVIDAVVAEAFQELGRRARNGGTNEFEMQQWILEAFGRNGVTAADGPNVSVNSNAGDPHYEPTRDVYAPIKPGDWVLIDLWGKKNTPHACYYDITWTGVVGTPTDEQRNVFNIVTGARDAAIEFVKLAVASGAATHGWQVDDAARNHIRNAGFGEYFTHRTGHSIGTEVHANGANMDNLEIHDERKLLPNSCFSIEPGIYLKHFGVRSEVNMLVRNGAAEVTGRIQREIVQV